MPFKGSTKHLSLKKLTTFFCAVPLLSCSRISVCYTHSNCDAFFSNFSVFLRLYICYNVLEIEKMLCGNSSNIVENLKQYRLMEQPAEKRERNSLVPRSRKLKFSASGVNSHGWCV